MYVQSYFRVMIYISLGQLLIDIKCSRQALKLINTSEWVAVHCYLFGKFGISFQSNSLASFPIFDMTEIASTSSRIHI